MGALSPVCDSAIISGMEALSLGYDSAIILKCWPVQELIAVQQAKGAMLRGYQTFSV